MGNAELLYINLSDEGTVTASSNIAAAPPSRLQNAHTTRRWQGRNGASESILLVFDEAQSIDTVVLVKCAGIFSGTLRALSDAATYRIRLSSVDTTGVAGDLYDSGTISNGISAAYPQIVCLRPTPVSAIAVLIDLSESGAEAILAGRLVSGKREPFSRNFDYGWSFGFIDLSRTRPSDGGQTFVDPDDTLRFVDVSFNWIEDADRYGFIQETDRLNGIKKDVLFIIDPDSANLPRDTIWGLMKDLSPPTQPHFGVFAKQYRISERL